jgi:hypothetical protein
MDSINWIKNNYTKPVKPWWRSFTESELAQINRQHTIFQAHYDTLSKLNVNVASILPGPDNRDSLSSKLEDLRETDRITINPDPDGPTIVLFEPVPLLPSRVAMVADNLSRANTIDVDRTGRIAFDVVSATAGNQPRCKFGIPQLYCTENCKQRTNCSGSDR